MDYNLRLLDDVYNIYEHYYNKISYFCNAYLNRINYYQNTSITIKKLDFQNKQKLIKKIIDEIDKCLIKINEKGIYIKKKFGFLKNSIINLINKNKEDLIGRINCKNYFLNKLNLVNNLKKQFEEIKLLIGNFNEKKVYLNNKRLEIINLNFINDERIKDAFTFRKNIFEFYQMLKKEIKKI